MNGPRSHRPLSSIRRTDGGVNVFDENGQPIELMKLDLECLNLTGDDVVNTFGFGTSEEQHQLMTQIHDYIGD